jgi:succinate dehydrogenase/fumarate reductase flavoprotein subunit
VTDAGGEGTIWVGELGSSTQERELAARMSETVAGEYQTVIEEAEALASEVSGQGKRSLARLRRELRQIRARDYFPPPERELAQQALEQLAATLDEVPA